MSPRDENVTGSTGQNESGPKVSPVWLGAGLANSAFHSHVGALQAVPQLQKWELIISTRLDNPSSLGYETVEVFGVSSGEWTSASSKGVKLGEGSGELPEEQMTRAHKLKELCLIERNGAEDVLDSNPEILPVEGGEEKRKPLINRTRLEPEPVSLPESL